MLTGLNQSLILFLLMGAGFLAGKMGILGKEACKGLSRFVLDFSLPALIIVSMQVPFSRELQKLAFSTLGISTLVYGLSFLLAWGLVALYRNAPSEEKGVHRFAMCFSNVGFMGFPLAEAFLGKESLFMVSIYNIPFQVLAFSVGIIMIAGRRKSATEEKRKIPPYINPAVISAIVGFFFFLFSVKIPGSLLQALKTLGDTTTPLSMAVIGAILSAYPIRPVMTRPRVWLTSLFRVLAYPLIVLVLGKLLGLNELTLAVAVLITAMPVAANTSILAAVHGGDSITAGGLVFLSTLLSLPLVPLIMQFL